jgi:hypothetical protein
MEYFPYLMILVFVAFFAFQAGAWSKEYPNEEEMIRRLKELRYERRLKAQVSVEVEEELRI